MANLLYRISTTPTVPLSTTAKNAPLTVGEVDGNFKSLNDQLSQLADGSYAYPANTTLSVNISGNAATVTNGLYSTGSYSDPSWLLTLDDSKVLPSMTGNSGKILSTDGTNSSWIVLPSQTSGSTLVGYIAYAGTTKTAGQLYGGTTAPASTTRLNYDGYLYATKFFGDGTGLTGLQPADADLTAIAGLAGTSGLLKKTAADTWALDTATYLTANQSITISGDASGTGTTAITLTLANSGATAGTYKSVTVNAKGLVTGGTNPTTLSGYGITDAQPLDADLTAIAGLVGTSGLLKKTAADTWSLDTNTYITGNQSITVSGDASGTGTTAITLTLANSGATAGTYKSVTVNAKGLVTGGTNPTTLSGYGITDAQPLDADLTAIAGLVGTSGILKKTATDTWTLDTNTYITGNQSITVSGDASGTGTTAITLTLANSGVTAGNYGSGTAIPVLSIDAKGRITSASTSSITLPTGQTAGSATAGYLSYAGTTKTAGQLDGGATDPTNTTRLNYDGYLYATKFYGDGSSLSGVGVTITDDVSIDNTRYLFWGSSTSGTASTIGVSSTKLYFNPNSGTLNAVNFNSLSDATLKTDVKPISNAVETINAIDGVEFTWKENGNKSYGVIAQEIEKVLPDIVETNNTGIKSVNYVALTGFLVQAIKELNIELAAIKAELASIK